MKTKPREGKTDTPVYWISNMVAAEKRCFQI